MSAVPAVLGADFHELCLAVQGEPRPEPGLMTAAEVVADQAARGIAAALQYLPGDVVVTDVEGRSWTHAGPDHDWWSGRTRWTSAALAWCAPLTVVKQGDGLGAFDPARPRNGVQADR